MVGPATEELDPQDSVWRIPYLDQVRLKTAQLPEISSAEFASKLTQEGLACCSTFPSRMRRIMAASPRRDRRPVSRPG